MGNTISSVYFEEIAMKVVEGLREARIRLQAFSLDVSPNGVDIKDAKTIKVPLVEAPDANEHTGSYSDNADTDDDTVDVETEKHYVATFHLTNLERQNIESGVWSKMAEEKVIGAVHNVAKAGIVYAMGKIKKATFTNETVCEPADFDSDFLTAQSIWADQQGLSERPGGRNIVIGSDYLGVAANDPLLANNFALGDAAPMREGMLTRAKGFDLHKFQSVPANSENLEGVVCGPQALAVAVRPIKTPDETRGEYILFEVITDEATGMSMTYAIWFDRDSRTIYHNVEAKFGAATGRAGALRRVVNAAT
jgi:hypothetical protein